MKKTIKKEFLFMAIGLFLVMVIGCLLYTSDAYAESYGTAMDGGMLDYLAGKFSASIGPIFIATYRADVYKRQGQYGCNVLYLLSGIFRP